MNLKKFFQISIYKTLRFNLHYFGGGGWRFPVIIAKNVKLNELKGKVSLQNPRCAGVQIGFGYVGIVDEKKERCIWENRGIVSFSGRANFGPGTRISCSGNLEIGDNVTVNARSCFIATNKIFIGENSLFSWDCLVMDTDFHSIYALNDVQKEHPLNSSKPIAIGKHCWIGCRNLILKGSFIADNTIISAGNTIRENYIKENTIIGEKGVVKQDIAW